MGVKPKILGVGGGLGVRGGGRAGIDWEDNDAHTASSNTQSSHNARHDIDARATQDFKDASDYFTSRKVSESGSHTDNNADSRVDQLSAALNSAKQSYDQYTTNMTRSHEYAEMASRTESMSGQMSEDLSQQFAQYVMKHAPQDAEAILTNTSSPEIAERRRAMARSFVQEQVQLVLIMRRESVAILVKEWRAYLRVVAVRILLLTIRDIRPLLSKERRTVISVMM